MIALQVFGQNVTESPGTGTFASHTPEVLIMLVGAFLLGWFLHHVIYGARYKARIAELEADLSRARAKLKDTSAELEDCRSSVVTLKGENAGLSTELSHLQAGAAIPEPPPMSEVETISHAIAADITDASAPVDFDAEGAKAVFGKRIKEDDLKIIEGIGPKTEELLNNRSIHTWRQLNNSSTDQLQGILNDAGDRFQLLNPSTWSKQAGMAADGDWLRLRSYQDWLVGGVEPEGEEFVFGEGAAQTHYVMGKRIAQDDLTLVEGIGPKISQLLQNEGINTWRKLSETSTERLQSILDAAGDRYRIHSPTTWPKQAELAANGKWEELQEYQDFLDGGVAPG